MRLTSGMREEILRFATAKLQKERQTFAKSEQQLLIDCYCAVVPQATRERLEVIDTKYTLYNFKWFEYAEDITFNVAGQTVRLGQANIPVSQRRKLAIPHHVWHSPLGVLTLAKNQKLVERVRDWQGKVEKEKTDYTTAILTLNQLLKSVSTVEKLKQYWPEGKDFFSSPPCQTRAASGVPAVQIEALNRMLGIKTEDLVID